MLPVALSLGGFFLYDHFFLRPRKIRDELVALPEFLDDNPLIKDGIGLAIDISRGKLAFHDGLKPAIFPYEKVIRFGYDPVKLLDGSGDSYWRYDFFIRLLDDNVPEIRFRTKSVSFVQQCENSLILLGEAFLKTSKFGYNESPPPKRIRDSKTDENATIDSLRSFLTERGFSRNDAKGSNIRERFDEATDLIFPRYETQEGFTLPYRGQETIQNALEPFFGRRPGEPKNRGFTPKTIKKYLSDNKIAWEENDKNRINYYQP